MKHMDSPEVAQFKADEKATKTAVNSYGSGGKDGQAPVRDIKN